VEQTEQSNAHGESVTNGTSNYNERIVTDNNLSNSVTPKAELIPTSHRDDFIEMFTNIMFGNEGMLLKDEIFAISPNNTFEQFGDIIDYQIALRKKEINQLSATKEYLHFFSIIYILNILKVVCFMELKRLLALNHNEQLYRLINFLLQRQVIRIAGISTNNEILALIELKTKINPKQSSYYELCSDFKGNINGKSERLRKLIPLHIVQEVVQQEIFYQNKKKELDTLMCKAVKNKKFLNKQKTEFWRIDNYCANNYKIGEQISRNKLIKDWTFFNNLISSESKAERHLNYLISKEYFSMNICNKELLIYNGIENSKLTNMEEQIR